MRQESLIVSKHLPWGTCTQCVCTAWEPAAGKQGEAGSPRGPLGEVPAQVPLGAVSGPVSLHILINYLGRRWLVNSKLIKFSDDANSGGFRKTSKGRGNIKGTCMGYKHEWKIKLSSG